MIGGVAVALWRISSSGEKTAIDAYQSGDRR
jgi:hypothetical protein